MLDLGFLDVGVVVLGVVELGLNFGLNRVIGCRRVCPAAIPGPADQSARHPAENYEVNALGARPTFFAHSPYY
jgi:hypothetical protein